MRWRSVLRPQRSIVITDMSLQDIDSIGPGEICAIFGVECASGDTFTDGTTNYSMVYFSICSTQRLS